MDSERPSLPPPSPYLLRRLSPLNKHVFKVCIIEAALRANGLPTRSPASYTYEGVQYGEGDLETRTQG